jgi:hypothetical protein
VQCSLSFNVLRQEIGHRELWVAAQTQQVGEVLFLRFVNDIKLARAENQKLFINAISSK